MCVDSGLHNQGHQPNKWLSAFLILLPTIADKHLKLTPHLLEVAHTSTHVQIPKSVDIVYHSYVNFYKYFKIGDLSTFLYFLNLVKLEITVIANIILEEEKKQLGEIKPCRLHQIHPPQVS